MFDQHHSIQLHASPHGYHWLSLHCDAPPDAPCRQQPTNPDDINDDGTWGHDTPTTGGHECWAVTWADAVGLDQLPIYCLGPLPRIPVTIRRGNGPIITIQGPRR